MLTGRITAAVWWADGGRHRVGPPVRQDLHDERLQRRGGRVLLPAHGGREIQHLGAGASATTPESSKESPCARPCTGRTSRSSRSELRDPAQGRRVGRVLAGSDAARSQDEGSLPLELLRRLPLALARAQGPLRRAGLEDSHRQDESDRDARHLHPGRRPECRSPHALLQGRAGRLPGTRAGTGSDEAGAQAAPAPARRGDARAVS